MSIREKTLSDNGRLQLIRAKAVISKIPCYYREAVTWINKRVHKESETKEKDLDALLDEILSMSTDDITDTLEEEHNLDRIFQPEKFLPMSPDGLTETREKENDSNVIFQDETCLSPSFRQIIEDIMELKYDKETLRATTFIIKTDSPRKYVSTMLDAMKYSGLINSMTYREIKEHARICLEKPCIMEFSPLNKTTFVEEYRNQRYMQRDAFFFLISGDVPDDLIPELGKVTNNMIACAEGIKLSAQEARAILEDQLKKEGFEITLPPWQSNSDDISLSDITEARIYIKNELLKKPDHFSEKIIDQKVLAELAELGNPLFADRSSEPIKKEPVDPTSLPSYQEILNCYGTDLAEQVLQFLYRCLLSRERDYEMSTALFLTGPSGIGKTRLGTTLFQLLYEAGLVNDPSPYVINAGVDFTDTTVGGAALKTEKVFKQFLRSGKDCIWVDEADALISAGAGGASDLSKDSSAKSVVKGIMQFMDFAGYGRNGQPSFLIFAGYDSAYEQFCNADTGLSGRLSARITLPVPTNTRVLDVLDDLIREHNLIFTEPAYRLLRERILSLSVKELEDMKFYRGIKAIVSELEGKAMIKSFNLDSHDIDLEIVEQTLDKAIPKEKISLGFA